MEIAIISEEFTPYTPSSRRGAYLASLSSEFVRLGHNVSLFLPMPEGLDVSRHSLARRLVSLSVTCGKETYDCTRYDGLTTSGVRAYLLEIDGITFGKNKSANRDDRSTIFSMGVAEILMALKLSPDWCVVVGAELTTSFDILKREPYALRAKHMYLDLDSEPVTPSLGETLNLADSVVIADSHKKSGVLSDSNHSFGEMIADGRATVIPMPAPAHDVLRAEEKISHKTTFQMRFGLPVRKNVPVVLFCDCVASETPDVLRSFLRSDVQAIAVKGNERLTRLAEKYPDRLALIESANEHDAMASADACVVGNDATLASLALTSGTIPIGGPGISSDIVDLEPSCQSGSGILVGDLGAQSLLVGLGRLATACSHESDFRALSARLPSYVPSWSEVANYYLQLMGA